VCHILPLKVINSHSFIGKLAENTAQRYGVSFGNNRINFVVFILGYYSTLQQLPDNAHRGLVGNKVLTMLIHLRSPPYSAPKHNTLGSNRSGPCGRSSRTPYRIVDKPACSMPSAALDPDAHSTNHYGTWYSRISSACGWDAGQVACHTLSKAPG
jgi:hypothetical protein